MALTPQILDQLLGLSDRQQLAREAVGQASPLSLAELRRLADHAGTLTPTPVSLRLAFVRTYTTELLQPWLEGAGALSGIEPAIYHAPYGVVQGESRADSDLVAHRPDMTVLMLQRSDLHPALGGPLAAMDTVEIEALFAEVLAHLKSIVLAFRALPVGHLVVTLLPAMAGPALGLHDVQAERSEVRFWHKLQDELGQWLRLEVPASVYLDLSDLIGHVGRRRALDPRHWLTARYPFSAEASFEFAVRLMGIARLLKAPRAKVLVLDADNTLWGGVIGEDGLDGVALGPDYPGSAYLAFQRRLLDFQQRGFILAMCSKNNAADVDEMLAMHPHQVLKAEHFVARRVNWDSKPANLIDLAQELGLGLESFIFVDDSDHECAAVRAQLPQVEVVQVPKRPHEVPACLDRVARLEVLSLTAEDRAKTDMYRAEQQRKQILVAADGDGGEFQHLHKLGMRMSVNVNPRNHVARLAQLTQKTNQFNLTTRRYDEQQISALVEADHWLVMDFSLADVFGDSGVVGLALVELTSPDTAQLDSFLMSCRVIGRCAEDAFMHAVLCELQRHGVNVLRAAFRSTHKNGLVRNLLPRLGFAATGAVEGDYTRHLQASPPRLPEGFPIQFERAVSFEQASPTKISS